MSGRATKWILLVFLPLLAALYSSYPPVGVPLHKQRVVKKVARTEEQAEAHGVEVGETYVADTDEVFDRFLPAALGKRSQIKEVTVNQAEGTVTEETTTVVQGRIKLGLDVAGGTELLYELKPEKGEEVSTKLGNTIEILKRRIDPGNVKEYRIQALEQNRILIQVPQATTAEVERLKGRLEQMGLLEFKLAVPRPPREEESVKLYSQAQEGQVPEGFVKMYLEGNPEEPFYLVKAGDPEITGKRLDPGSLTPTMDRYGAPAVGFQFDAVGTRKFADTTEAHQGDWALAIVLDGVLKSAPLIRERIAGRGQITGDFTQQEVNRLVNVLRAGSLPMNIELLQESTVGPQLGRDSIQRGLLALAVAGFLVLFFIGFYYLRCGMVADGALIMNLVLLVGVLCLLGAALTLPGMAGILLTVGMAVDANVLIFERIREESESGKGVSVALRNGYDRAFTTIVDANVTTLLTAVILYLVGTGPVRGFAITLSFGILLSMFTALVVTRLAFETMIDRGSLEQFSMFSLIKRPEIRFDAIRKPAYVISAAVLGVGLFAFFARGSDLYDVDFTGGSLINLSLAKPTPVEQVRSMLAEGGFPRAEVQGLGRGRGGRTDFAVRIKGAGTDIETARKEVKRKLEAAQILGEDDRLKATSDKRALELRLAEPAKEMLLRSALAEGEDPYALEGLGVAAPGPDTRTKHVRVRPQQVPALAEQRVLWGTMLRALSWAELGTEACTIAQTQSTGEGKVRLTLGRPVEWELLAVELDRRGFPEIQVDTTAEPDQFLLSGPPQALARFQRELPAGSELASLPKAQVEGSTIEAHLDKAFSEQDLRAFFEQQGISDVYVVPLDVASTSWTLELSFAPVRAEMQKIFADLAPARRAISFEPVDGGNPPEGKVRARMILPESMAFADVRYQLDAPAGGIYAEELIEDYEQYGVRSQVSELTLLLPEKKAEQIKQRIQDAFGPAQPVQRIVRIGSTVAEEMQGRALLAVICASVIIVLYVAMRFHAFRFGVAAVIALVHDVLITAGLLALADWSGMLGDVKISLATLAAFLTILGYSLNDTIVVFDRIRENMVEGGSSRLDGELISLSINQTLSRTILTSLTTLAVVVVLYVLGGAVLQGLALTLMIGVVVGTYSSMFIASPVLLDWKPLGRATRTFFWILFLPLTLPFKLIAALLGRSK